MEAAPAVPFRIDAAPVGGRLVVDGKDLTSKTHALTLAMGHGQATVLTIETGPGVGVIEGVAIVQQVDQGQPIEFDPAEVAALVRTIDPLLVRELMEQRQLPVTADQYAATIDIIAGLIEQVTGQ